MSCKFCHEILYRKVKILLKSAFSPVTYIDYLRDELINKTGEEYMPVQKNYCHICGSKLEEKI